jgi:hypothetical protein
MLKRLAALLFIFVMAGQVSAGVCGCLGGENRAQHSCCKRKKMSRDAISAKSCCETDCLVRHSEKLVQDRTQAGPKIKFQAAASPVKPGLALLLPTTTRIAVVVSPYSDHRLKYARPPELYVRHRALLI